MHAQARAVMRRMANESDDIWECGQCGAHRPRGTKCCGRYLGLNDGCGTKVERRRNVHAHPDADEDEVADFLQAHLARLDRERAAEPRVRAPTPGDDPSTDGDESDERDDGDSDDDHDPVTRTALIRAVHLGFELAFEGMGHFVHPKKAEVTLGDLNAATLAHRARFNLIVHNKAPASKHYGAARISVLVPEFAMGNRDEIEGIGTRRGSYPTTIELAPLHTSGEFFNGSDRNITHPMMDEAGDSLKRFYLTGRPYRYGHTPGDLVIPIEDRIKIFDWVLKFLDYAPPSPPSRPEVQTISTKLGPIGINKEPDPNEKLPLVDRVISFRPSATTDIRTSAPPNPPPNPPHIDAVPLVDFAQWEADFEADLRDDWDDAVRRGRFKEAQPLLRVDELRRIQARWAEERAAQASSLSKAARKHRRNAEKMRQWRDGVRTPDEQLLQARYSDLNRAYGEATTRYKTTVEKLKVEREAARAETTATQKSSYNAQECVVCMDAARTEVALPCKHFCVCAECAGRIERKCPICNGAVEAWLGVRMA